MNATADNFKRIELGEVEYAVSRTEGCKSAAAEVIDGSLIVFCLRAKSTLDEAEVRRTSAKWLPSFMVPTDVFIMDSLPYLPSGKIDRRALLDHYARFKRPPSDAELPQSETQRQIVEVLSRVLGKSLDPGTSLQAAGLDSLSAIRFASALSRAGSTLR